MIAPTVVRCYQCRSAAIAPHDHNDDNLKLIVHAPWCRHVAPTRQMEAPSSALGAHRRSAMEATR